MLILEELNCYAIVLIVINRLKLYTPWYVYLVKDRDYYSLWACMFFRGLAFAIRSYV